MTGLGYSCGACKFLRRKCTSECVFAPYFCYDEAAKHFAAVHKVFGASNVSKLLLHLPIHSRRDAAITMSYEALARIRDPVYGCVAHIFALQQQVVNLQEEIEMVINQMANHAVDQIPSRGNIQFAYPPHETMSSLVCCEDGGVFTLHDHPGFVDGNLILNSEFFQPFPHLLDQSFVCNFYQNPPEMVNFEGSELGIVKDHYPCMGDIFTTTTNWENISCEKMNSSFFLSLENKYKGEMFITGHDVI